MRMSDTRALNTLGWRGGDAPSIYSHLFFIVKSYSCEKTKSPYAHNLFWLGYETHK